MRTTHGGPSGPQRRTKFEHGRFVGWDGEGATDHERTCLDRESGGCGCPHRYVFLMNSTGAELVRPEGIRTHEALAFLTSEAARLGPNVTHVCFGVSYDGNMMLGDLDRATVSRIWKGERVRLSRRWKVAYRARKTLWVKDYSTGVGVTLWDPFGFYQSSFIKAVGKNLGWDDARLPLIRQGKARRSEFSPDDIPFMRKYTGAEVSALVDLMGNLRTALQSANLQLRRWDGAGAVAAALLNREGVRSHLAVSPDEVQEAALYAYAGGRIECLLYGCHVGTIHHADIRSAYPYAATLLPSLRHGHWRRMVGRSPSEEFSVVKVRWNFSRLGDRRHILPFAFRSAHSAIYFPRRGTNWVWRPELDAALKDDLFRPKIEILDGWEFVPKDRTERPFRFLSEIYKRRREMKRLKDPAEKVLKLGPNSVYGKLAQHVGGTAEKPPPFHQLEYAGYITSYTRARLFRTALSAGDACITLATDGIYSTAPLTGLKVSEELGDWEYTNHDAMLIAQSGVYFLRDRAPSNGRCKECGGPVRPVTFGCVRCADETCGWSNLVEHFRGFDEDTLNPDVVLDAWGSRETMVNASSTRFITMGRASQTDDAFLKWRRWVSEERDLEIHATGKRVDRIEPARWTRTMNPARRLMATDPADPLEEESSPYTLAWAVEQGETSADAQEQTSL